MRLAVIADIHGNMPALEAVMADFSSLTPDYVILAGDLINPLPFSVEVVEYVMRQEWLVIRGNHEYYYLDFNSNRIHPDVNNEQRWGALHSLQRTIPPPVGNYLATLPDDLALMWPGTEPLRVVHGMPGDPRAGLFVEYSDIEAAHLLAKVPQHTVITAHTHVPGERRIARSPGFPSPKSPNPPFRPDELRAQEWHIINPGSIGLPLNGSPMADYVILDSVADAPESQGWKAEFRQVSYDRRKTLHAFHESESLATGGPIAELFYWELVTAEKEISVFFRWSQQHGFDVHQEEFEYAFNQYKLATDRDRIIEQRDPTGRYHANWRRDRS